MSVQIAPWFLHTRRLPIAISPSTLRRSLRFFKGGEFHLMRIIVIAKEFEEFRGGGEDASDEDRFASRLLDAGQFGTLAVEKVTGDFVLHAHLDAADRFAVGG